MEGGCLKGKVGRPPSEHAEVVGSSTPRPQQVWEAFPAAEHWSDLQELVEREGASLLPIPLFRDRGRTSGLTGVVYESGTTWLWLSGGPPTSFLLPSTASTLADAARPLSSGDKACRSLWTSKSLLRSNAPGDWHCVKPQGLNGGAAIPLLPASTQRFPFEH